MTTTMELIHKVHIPAEDKWAHDNDTALLHLSKEMGANLFKSAIARNNGNVEPLIEEAKRQLANIPVHRDAKGLILTGLLDLTKLSITPEEAAARKLELNPVQPVVGETPSLTIMAANVADHSLIDDVAHQCVANR